jgi:hypothetical protein
MKETKLPKFDVTPGSIGQPFVQLDNTTRRFAALMVVPAAAYLGAIPHYVCETPLPRAENVACKPVYGHLPHIHPEQPTGNMSAGVTVFATTSGTGAWTNVGTGTVAPFR